MTDALTKLKGELFVINNASNGAYSNKALQADRHIQLMAESLYNLYGVTSLSDIGTKTIPAVPAHYEKVDTGKTTKVPHQVKYPNSKKYYTTYTWEPVYTSKLIPVKPAYEITINKLNGKEIPAKFGSTGEGEGWTDYNLQAVKQANGTTLYVPAPQWKDSSDWNKIAPIIFIGLSLTGAGGLIGAAVGLEGAAASAFGVATISTAIQAAAGKIGNVGDVLESFAKGFAGDYLGNLVGKEVGSVIDSTFGNSDVANVIKQTVVNATKGTIQSIVKTGKPGDIVETFKNAGVSAAIPFVLGQVPGISNLSPGSQKIIGDALAAKLSKQPVTAAVIQSAIAASGIITDSVKGMNLTPQQERLLVSGISNTATALIQNKPIDQALMKTMVKAGQDSFNELAKTGVDSLKKNLSADSQKNIKTAGDLSYFIEKSSADLSGLIDTISASQNRQSVIQDRLTTIKGQLDPAMTEFNAAQKDQETATNNYYSLIESGGSLQDINNQIDVLNKANEKYSIASSSLQNRWNKFKDETNSLNKELDTLKTTVPTSIEKFNKLKLDLTEAGSNLDEYNKKLNDHTKIAFVKSLAPEFDAKQYSDLHGNPPEDSYDHWLASGLSLPINQAEQKLKDLSDNQAIADGLSKSANAPVSMIDQKAIDALEDSYKKYGDKNGFLSAKAYASAAYTAGQNNQKTFQITGEDGSIYTVNTPPELLAQQNLPASQAYANAALEAAKNGQKKFQITGEDGVVYTLNTPPELTANPSLSSANKYQAAAYEAGKNGQKTFVFTGEDGVSYKVNTPFEFLPKPNIVKQDAPTLTTVYGSWNKPSLDVFELPSGAKFATPDQIYKDRTATMLRNPDGSYVWVQIQSARVRDQKYGISDPDEIKKIDPIAYISTLKNIPAELRPTSLQKEDSDAVKYANGLIDRLKDNNAPGVIMNGLSMLLNAGNSVANIASLVASTSGIDSKNTAAGKAADILSNLSDRARTPELQADLDKMTSDVSDAKGFFATGSAIAQNIFQNPTSILGYYVGSEAISELFTGGVGALAGRLAGSAARGLNATKEIASKISARTGFTVAEGSEAFAGAKSNFDDAYKDVYSAAIKSGKSPVEASEMAMAAGLTVAASTILTSTALQAKSPDDLTNLLFKNKKTAASENFKDGLTGYLNTVKKTVAGETKEEFYETGVPSQVANIFKAASGLEVDPGKDLAQAAYAGLIGGLTGGTVASGAGIRANANILTNPDIAIAVAKAQKIAPTDSVGLASSLSSIRDAVKSSGITDATDIAYIANIANSKFAITPEEIDKIYQAEGAGKPTEAVYKSLVGVGADQNKVLENARSAIDPNYVSKDEIQDIAKKFNGFVVPDDVAAKYTGPGKEVDILQKAQTEIKVLAESSTSTSIAASKSASVSNSNFVFASQSNSISISKSVSASKFTSASSSYSAFQSASQSTRTFSISASKSTSVSNSISISGSTSASASTIASSISASKSISASNLISVSTSKSASQSGSISASKSILASISGSVSSSKSISVSAITSSISASSSRSTSIYNSTSQSISTSKKDLSDKASLDKSSKDKASIDKAISEKSGQEKASLLKVSIEKASKDKASADKASIDKASVEKASVVKASVEKASLDKVSIAKASVEKASIDKASIDKASVEKASVVKASVEKASIEKASIAKASVEKASIDKASIDKASVEKASVVKASVEKASIEKASIAKASVEKASIDKASIAKASVEKASIEKASVVKASVEKASIAKASVEKASIDKASIAKASVEKASTEKASIAKASVEKASIEKASVVKASVEKASIAKASVEKASTEKASIAKASVEKASIEKASVVKASVEKASIDKASIAKASVEKASVVKASVEKASLDKASIAKASVEKASIDKVLANKTQEQQASILAKVSADKASIEKASADVSSSALASASISTSVKTSTETFTSTSISASISASTSASVSTSISASASVSVTTSVSASVSPSISTSVNTSLPELSPPVTSGPVSSPPVSSEPPSSSLPVTSEIVSSPPVSSGPPSSSPPSSSPPSSSPPKSSPPVSPPPVSSPAPKSGFQFTVPQIAEVAAAATPFLETTTKIIGGTPQYKGILDQFFAKAKEPLAPTRKPLESEMPKQQYYEYGESTPIGDILGETGEQPATEEQGFARGGLAAPFEKLYKSGKMRTDFRRGDAVSGPGDGQSDDIPAMLADGEFVFPADVVAALGNGSTKAGSDRLYKMMHDIRARARKAAPKELPPKALSPLEYLKRRK